MINQGPNYTKKICKLFYQDKIWELARQGKSVREITDLINRHFIPRSKFKGVTLSKSTIHTIIKKAQK
jgi:hypothetical protein